MKRIHWAPVTEATYLEAMALDIEDERSFLASIGETTSPELEALTTELEARTVAPRTVAVRLEADGTPRPVIVLTLLMAIAALAIVLATVAPSHADPVPAAPGGVYVAKVDPAPAGPRITVTLSNGKSAKLNPCRYEDGRQCYWQADTMGNGIGRSFVVMSGRVFRVNLAGMAL